MRIDCESVTLALFVLGYRPASADPVILFSNFDPGGPSGLTSGRAPTHGKVGADQDVLSGVKESMNKVVRPVVVGVVLSFCSPAFAQLARDAAIAKAETILKNLQNGQTADVVKELDTTMAQALSEEKLKAAWPGLVGQFGAYKSINERREGQYQGRQAVELFLAFEKDTIVMRTVFDAEGRIGGLVFRPQNLAVLPASK